MPRHDLVYSLLMSIHYRAREAAEDRKLNLQGNVLEALQDMESDFEQIVKSLQKEVPPATGRRDWSEGLYEP